MKHIDDKLQMLGQLSLGTTLIVGARRYGGYYASLVTDGENVGGLGECYSEDTGYEGELEANEWFPAVIAQTPLEALAKLDERLQKITLSSAAIQKWLLDVSVIERAFVNEHHDDLVHCNFQRWIAES